MGLIYGALCAGIFLVIVCLIINSRSTSGPSHYSNQSYHTTPTASQPIAYTLTCPHCGKANYIYYIPGKDSLPALFKCNDCLRYYGNVSSMTSVEQLNLQESDDACQRVDQMPELTKLIDAVELFFRYYSAKSNDLPMVTIKNGRIEVAQANGIVVGKRLLATYSETSKIGDQHITYLCYKRLLQSMPNSSFSFGHWNIGMDVPNK